jgi:aspartyl protease family protein
MLRSILWLVVFAVAAALLLPDVAGRLFERRNDAAISAKRDEQRALSGIARIPADSRGHYGSVIQVNGRPVEALVDTGASLVTLRYEDARTLGLIFPGDRYDVGVSTANGTARAKRVKLRSVRVGPISVSDVDALVLDRGVLGTNLLGMSFLRRLSRYEVRGSTLVLER